MDGGNPDSRDGDDGWSSDRFDRRRVIGRRLNPRWQIERVAGVLLKAVASILRAGAVLR